MSAMSQEPHRPHDSAGPAFDTTADTQSLLASFPVPTAAEAVALEDGWNIDDDCWDLDQMLGLNGQEDSAAAPELLSPSQEPAGIGGLSGGGSSVVPPLIGGLLEGAAAVTSAAQQLPGGGGGGGGGAMMQQQQQLYGAVVQQRQGGMEVATRPGDDAAQQASPAFPLQLQPDGAAPASEDMVLNPAAAAVYREWQQPDEQQQQGPAQYPYNGQIWQQPLHHHQQQFHPHPHHQYQHQHHHPHQYQHHHQHHHHQQSGLQQCAQYPPPQSSGSGQLEPNIAQLPLAVDQQHHRLPLMPVPAVVPSLSPLPVLQPPPQQLLLRQLLETAAAALPGPAGTASGAAAAGSAGSAGSVSCRHALETTRGGNGGEELQPPQPPQRYGSWPYPHPASNGLQHQQPTQPPPPQLQSVHLPARNGEHMDLLRRLLAAGKAGPKFWAAVLQNGDGGKNATVSDLLQPAATSASGAAGAGGSSSNAFAAAGSDRVSKGVGCLPVYATLPADVVRARYAPGSPTTSATFTYIGPARPAKTDYTTGSGGYAKSAFHPFPNDVQLALCGVLGSLLDGASAAAAASAAAVLAAAHSQPLLTATASSIAVAGGHGCRRAGGGGGGGGGAKGQWPPTPGLCYFLDKEYRTHCLDHHDMTNHKCTKNGHVTHSLHRLLVVRCIGVRPEDACAGGAAGVEEGAAAAGSAGAKGGKGGRRKGNTSGGDDGFGGQLVQVKATRDGVVATFAFGKSWPCM